MKKYLLLGTLLGLGPAEQAQGQALPPLGPELTQEIVRSTVALLVLLILAGFLLRVLQLVLTDRLKKRLLEAGAPDAVVAQLVPPTPSTRLGALKGVFLLTATGLGLTVAYCQQPWGVPSVIILLFSLALGLLGYYLVAKRAAA